MSVAGKERRREIDGSLICENGHLRLRVFRVGRSLGVILDTRGLDMVWGSLGLTLTGDDIVLRGSDGAMQHGTFFAFDPVDVAGETRGVTLHGHLGEATIALTVQLDDRSTWCRQRLTVTGVQDVGGLVQRWRLIPDAVLPEQSWPMSPTQGEALAYCPVIFAQSGPIFTALMADLEDEDPSPYGAAVQLTEGVTLEYGLWQGPPLRWQPGAPLQLASVLGLDARALPDQGFQQAARLLGSREELTLVGRSSMPPRARALPALTAVPRPLEWQPFVWEGAPAAIAAAVRFDLDRAAEGDMQALEDGLCWLDRLCLQQRAVGTPDDTPLGAFGPSEEWRRITVWMPGLLMQAFRLTGIPEYGYRAQAALHALPAEQQAAVVAQLRPTFGDVYIQADYGELISLSGPDITAACFTLDGVELAVVPSTDTPILRLVLDGADAQYALGINGKSLGAFPTAELSTGVEILVNR